MTIHNPEIAHLLSRYAVLLEVKGANPFRIRAYRNAARTIENLPRDIATMLHDGADLTALPGIGDDLAHKLKDIVETEKFADYEKIKRELPAALADLAEVPGIGPKRIKALYSSLRIRSVDDLVAAAKSGKLRRVEGFGPKTEASILKLAQRHAKAGPARTRLCDAEQVATPLVEYLSRVEGVGKVAVAGSYRRRCETVGDLDILVTCAKGSDVVGRFVAYGDVAEIIAQGETRAAVRLKSGMQVDLRVVPQKSYGAALLYFTGSKAHNIALRTLGLKRKLKINEYGVYRGKRCVAGKTEEDVYAALRLPYIAPELRENQGEIQAAAAGKLPRLVTVADIAGDLHVHTDASDGQSSLAEMVEAAGRRGYEYVAISDHSKQIGITHGLDAKRLAAQMRAIDRLNARSPRLRILKAIEVDILPDGKLALPDSCLADLDVVVAAVHSKLDLDAKAQTERIIRAMDNRHVNVIAHPLGRLIGEREACQLDMERLMKAALERGCILELNAQPSRLDVTDACCRMAKEMGLKLVISTDAHSAETLDYMRFGVDQARRGGLEASDVLNTRGVVELLGLLKRK